MMGLVACQQRTLSFWMKGPGVDPSRRAVGQFPGNSARSPVASLVVHALACLVHLVRDLGVFRSGQGFGVGSRGFFQDKIEDVDVFRMWAGDVSLPFRIPSSRFPFPGAGFEMYRLRNAGFGFRVSGFECTGYANSLAPLAIQLSCPSRSCSATSWFGV